MEALDSYLELINTSAGLIKAHLAAQATNDQCESGFVIAESISGGPPGVKEARRQMQEGIGGLQRAVTGPVELWEQMTLNHQYLSCFRWVLHFKIPTIVPLSQQVSYDKVAEEAGVPRHQLRHIVRMLITHGFFAEPAPEQLAHSALSAHFVDGSLFLEANQFLTDVAAATTYRMTEMTAQYWGSEKPNETAFNIALQTTLPFFAYLGQNPPVAARLASGMKVLGGKDGTHTRHLVSGFDWQELGRAKIIDIGGSSGHASIAIAECFPDLEFEIQDLPEVIAKAKEATILPALAPRITFAAHDFFQPQPASSAGASAFLVRLVLQNHSTPAAQSILRNIAGVMRPGAVILVNNTLIPAPGQLGAREEALERARCLFMMQAMNGIDRDEAEFRALVEGAKAGLKVREIRNPGGGAMAVIVVEKA